MTHGSLEKLFSYPEIQLVYRPRPRQHFGPQLLDANDAYNVLMEVWNQNRIELVTEGYMLLLDAEQHLFGISHLSTGDKDWCHLDKKRIILTALKANKSDIILAYNRPNGYPDPGNKEIQLVQELRESCNMFDIHVRDHLIICPAGFYSFREDGQFEPFSPPVPSTIGNNR